MSFSRRQFLVGTGAGLILPAFYDQAVAFIGAEKQPLLIAPPTEEHTLYAEKRSDGSYELLLDDKEPTVPSMTLREYALNHYESLEDYIGEMEGLEPEEVKLADFDYDWEEFVDDELVIESTSRVDFPSGAAWEFLFYLDLGEQFESESGRGDLTFMDGGGPSNDYLGVYAADDLTLSLLQQRLNDLDCKTRIEIF